MFNKLSLFGFNLSAVQWFLSYLTDRTQSVSVNGTISEPMPIQFGVPQGSVFFSLIYLLMNYWTDNEHRDHKQATKRNRTHTIDTYFPRQERGNRLLIQGELYQHTSKQDVLKQRSSSLASRSIYVDCLAIGRQVNQCRRPKHSLWLNKRYIWNSKTKIVKYRHSKGTEGFIAETRRFPTVVQLSRPVQLIGSRAFGSLII